MLVLERCRTCCVNSSSPNDNPFWNWTRFIGMMCSYVWIYIFHNSWLMALATS
jgi:hypothetical protein